MPLVLDLEVTDGKNAAEVWAWTKAFMGELKSLTGRAGTIYTGYYFWKDNCGNPKDNLGADLGSAGYIPTPLIPEAWKTWTFWQYTDKEAVPGIGHCDGDYFHADEAALRALCYA